MRPLIKAGRVSALVTFRSGASAVRLAFATLVLLVHASFGRAGHAQGIPVWGVVVTESGAPISSATIELIGAVRRTESRSDGSFHLLAPPGEWWLVARRIGFRPDSQFVRTAGVSVTPFLFRLKAHPQTLRGLVTTGQASANSALTIGVENIRQVPAIGEPDIFRLLPMLPGITQANDLIGRVHLAAGASDEHRIELDGHPLQAPFHALSILGALNVATLDRADVFLHDGPFDQREGLSGTIALTSRPTTDASRRELAVSILSTGAVYATPLGKSGGLLAGGRVTYLDKVLRGYAETAGTSDDLVAPGFYDMLIRADRSMGKWRAHALIFSTKDYWFLRGLPRDGISPRWGETLLGLTAEREGYHAHSTFRVSRNYGSVSYRDSIDSPFSSEQSLDVVDVSQIWTSVSAGLRLRAGTEFLRLYGSLDHRDHNLYWSGTKASDWFTPTTPDTVARRQRQSLATFSSEIPLRLSSRVAATAGQRLSIVDGEAYVAPYARVTIRSHESATTELALRRRQQFDAIAEEPLEGTTAQPVYLLSRPRVVDLSALSTFWQPAGSARRVGATLFYKRYRDRPALKRSGDLAVFPEFQSAPGTALGASLAAQWEFGSKAVVHGAYTFQKVRETIGGRSEPTSWDSPHSLTLFGSAPAPFGWSVTSAFQIRSGTAVTPVRYRILYPIAPGVFSPRFIMGDPNSVRLPGYRRLDVGLRKSWRAGRREWSFSLHVLNVLVRTNVLEYEWGAYFACQGALRCEDGAIVRKKGLPVIPSAGLEVKW